MAGGHGLPFQVPLLHGWRQGMRLTGWSGLRGRGRRWRGMEANPRWSRLWGWRGTVSRKCVARCTIIQQTQVPSNSFHPAFRNGTCWGPEIPYIILRGFKHLFKDPGGYHAKRFRLAKNLGWLATPHPRGKGRGSFLWSQKRAINGPFLGSGAFGTTGFVQP